MIGWSYSTDGSQAQGRLNQKWDAKGAIDSHAREKQRLAQRSLEEVLDRLR